MSMKLVKKTDEYSIYQRRDGRYAVQDANKNAVNGDDKARILVAEELIKVTLPSPAEPEEAAEAEAAEGEGAEEAAAEEAAEEAGAEAEPEAEAAPDASDEEDK